MTDMQERPSIEEAYWIKHGHPTQEHRQRLGRWGAWFLLASILIPILIAVAPIDF